MTEQGTGADPTQFTTTAVLEGDEWVINGTKWFVSNADRSHFHVLMAVTDPDADRHRRASMIIVPSDTPGIELRPRLLDERPVRRAVARTPRRR